MSIKMSKDSARTDIISNGDGSNPIQTQSPLTGDTVDLQLFYFNDDPTDRFENLAISATDTTDTDESNWIQFAPDNNGSPGVFLTAGDDMSLPDLTDANISHAFWIRVTSPVVSDVQNKTDIDLKIDFRRFAV